jgi:RNA polymerase sigma-70 factor (ECF subfamily)
MGPADHHDLQQVRDAIAREPAAVAWLTERLQRIPRYVAGLARRFAALTDEDVQDMSSEVTTAVLRRLAEFGGHCAFDAWVNVFCQNTLLGYARRRRRQRMPSLEVEPATADSAPIDEAERRERARRLRDSIDRIGGAEADVLRQRHFDGLDFGNISERTGTPVATLRTRYYRGLRKLKDMLTDEDVGEAPV